MLGKERSGFSEFYDEDTVILEAGLKSERSLAKDIKAKVREVYFVRDYVESHAESEKLPLKVRELLFRYSFL
jgi:hypothetical protein